MRLGSSLQAVAAQPVDDVSAFRGTRVEVVHGVDDVEGRQHLRSPRCCVGMIWVAAEAMDRD